MAIGLEGVQGTGTARGRDDWPAGSGGSRKGRRGRVIVELTRGARGVGTRPAGPGWLSVKPVGPGVSKIWPAGRAVDEKARRAGGRGQGLRAMRRPRFVVVVLNNRSSPGPLFEPAGGKPKITKAPEFASRHVTTLFDPRCREEQSLL